MNNVQENKSVKSVILNILREAGNYVSVKRIGYYLLIPAFLLCFIAPFVHRAGFGGTDYFNQTAFLIPLIGSIISLLLSTFKYTARYGALATFVTSFVSLLSFVASAYLHLGSAFFDGVAGSLFGIFKQMGFNFSFCLVAYVVSMLLSIAATFLPAPFSKELEA